MEDLKLKYPHIEELMKKCEYHYEEYFNSLDKLEEFCPVEGYSWMHDPNDQILVLRKDIDTKSEEWVKKQEEYQYSQYLKLKEHFENNGG